MRALLDPDIDPEPGREGLFEADAHAQPNHGGERAVRNRGRDLDDDGADPRARRLGRMDVDVWKVDDGE